MFSLASKITSTIRDKLLKLKGIVFVCLVGEDLILKIHEIEEKRNLGVFEVLRKGFVFLAVHDSSFRASQEEIVRDVVGSDGGVVFPAISFLEIPKAIVASPGWAVHSFLVERFKDKYEFKEGDSTLLIGVDKNIPLDKIL